MTRVVVIADSGHALATLTAAVEPLGGAYIVRHGSGQCPLERLIAVIAPDLVVIADLQQHEDAVARLAEIRRAAPGARVVVLSSRPGIDWIGAAAVVAAAIDADALAAVLRRVISAEGKHAAPAPVPELVPERPARAGDQGPSRPRRARVALAAVEQAA